MILLIDNYDSFTYNLFQYLSELGQKVRVFRNDQLDLKHIGRLRPDRIVISPGPCTPKEAGISNDVIRNFSGRLPILGVCLGHQCIGYAFGGRIVRAKQIMHGKVSQIFHRGTRLFQNIPSPFQATRYHSLVIEKKTMPCMLEITAWTRDGEIMGVRHKKHATFGVQFHPESILTPEGKRILRNFLEFRTRPTSSSPASISQSH